MNYRGRLLVPFLVELHQLDTEATAADPDGAGSLESGFDPDFREPVMLDASTSSRKEKTAIKVLCQVEEETEAELDQRAAANDPTWKMRFVFHFEDLEAAGLVDPATGRALIKLNDRASAIYTADGVLEQKLDTMGGGGLYCTEARPSSFGLSGGRRNLLVTTFARRKVTS